MTPCRLGVESPLTRHESEGAFAMTAGYSGTPLANLKLVVRVELEK